MPEVDRTIEVLIEAKLDKYFEQLATAENRTKRSARSMGLRMAGLATAVFTVSGAFKQLNKTLDDLDKRGQPLGKFLQNRDNLENFFREIPIAGRFIGAGADIGKGIENVVKLLTGQLQKERELERVGRIREKTWAATRDIIKDTEDILESTRRLDEKEGLITGGRRSPSETISAAEGRHKLAEIERERKKAIDEATNAKFQSGIPVPHMDKHIAALEAFYEQRKQLTREEFKDKELKILRDKNKEWLQIESSNRAALLRLDGKTFEAREVMIKADYDARIKAAQDENNDRKALGLMVGRRIALDQLEKDRRNNAPSIVQSFSTRLGTFKSAATGSPMSKMDENQQTMISLLGQIEKATGKEQVTLMEDLASLLRGIEANTKQMNAVGLN